MPWAGWVAPPQGPPEHSPGPGSALTKPIHSLQCGLGKAAGSAQEKAKGEGAGAARPLHSHNQDRLSLKQDKLGQQSSTWAITSVIL